MLETLLQYTRRDLPACDAKECSEIRQPSCRQLLALQGLAVLDSWAILRQTHIGTLPPLLREGSLSDTTTPHLVC